MNPLAGVLAMAFSTYKTHWRHLLTIAFVVYIVVTVLQLLLIQLSWIGALLALCISIIAVFLLQAALVKAVEDLGDGRADMTWGQTLQAARPYIGSVALASILAGIAIAIGLILFIVPGLFLITIWSMIIPVIVLEGATATQAFERSRRLVSGYGWQVFGTLVLAWLILLACNLVLGLVLAPLPNAAQSAVSNLISGTVFAPYVALVITIGYYRLRSAPRPGMVPPPPAA